MYTDVVFRKFMDNHAIIALFPNEIAVPSKGYCLSYMQIGQHASADYIGLLKITTLATETEYQDIKKELERIGYKLRVIKRWTKKYNAAHYN